jgi:hypothetical protein
VRNGQCPTCTAGCIAFIDHAVRGANDLRFSPLALTLGILWKGRGWLIRVGQLVSSSLISFVNWMLWLSLGTTYMRTIAGSVCHCHSHLVGASK